MNRETVHILVGAAVLLAAPLLLIVFFSGDARTSSADGYELTARYNRVDGVTIGTDVLLAGAPVGKVTQQEFDAETLQAVLTFTLRDDIQFPTDTAALIVSDGLLGGKFIKLDPGGAEEMLAPGDSFEYVQDAIIVEALLEKVVLWAEARRLEARKKAGKESDREAGTPLKK
ncbi:MAG: MCE family protein [Alphaproteobacteria bacterium]|nr:MCE family protein [Alphaproteobacteria bacterium]